jgi:hypothetical protein
LNFMASRLYDVHPGTDAGPNFRGRLSNPACLGEAQ